MSRLRVAASRGPGEVQVMRNYLRISGTLFGLIALGHLLRLLFRWPAEVAHWLVPLWFSLIGLVLPAALGIWAFRLARQVQRRG